MEITMQCTEEQVCKVDHQGSGIKVKGPRLDVEGAVQWLNGANETFINKSGEMYLLNIAGTKLSFAVDLFSVINLSVLFQFETEFLFLLLTAAFRLFCYQKLNQTDYKQYPGPGPTRRFVLSG